MIAPLLSLTLALLTAFAVAAVPSQARAEEVARDPLYCAAQDPEAEAPPAYSPEVAPPPLAPPAPAASEALVVEEAPAAVRRPDKPYWRQNLFVRLWRDQGFLFKTWIPSEVRRTGFDTPILIATLFAARSSSSSSLDRSLSNGFASSVHGDGITFSHSLTSLGNGPFAAALLGTTYLFSRVAHNNHLAETASLSTEALINAGIWVTVLKEVASRERPGDGRTGRFFQYGGQQSGSFPSGHAIGAFAVATVFAQEYRDTKWVPWIAYGTATLIGAARVALGRHYLSDVVVGAVLGNSFGNMALARSGEDNRGFFRNLGPLYDPDHRRWGVGWHKSW